MPKDVIYGAHSVAYCTKSTAPCQGEMYSTEWYSGRMEKSPPHPPQLDDPDERLRWLRQQAGFKEATEAARRYGWNENTYRSHENGTRALSRQAAEKYAKKYKATTGWLLYGEGSMTPPIDPEIATLWSNLGPEEQDTIRRLMKQMAKHAA